MTILVLFSLAEFSARNNVCSLPLFLHGDLYPRTDTAQLARSRTIGWESCPRGAAARRRAVNFAEPAGDSRQGFGAREPSNASATVCW